MIVCVDANIVIVMIVGNDLLGFLLVFDPLVVEIAKRVKFHYQMLNDRIGILPMTAAAEHHGYRFGF